MQIKNINELEKHAMNYMKKHPIKDVQLTSEEKEKVENEVNIYFAILNIIHCSFDKEVEKEINLRLLHKQEYFSIFEKLLDLEENPRKELYTLLEYFKNYPLEPISKKELQDLYDFGTLPQHTYKENDTKPFVRWFKNAIDPVPLAQHLGYQNFTLPESKFFPELNFEYEGLKPIEDHLGNFCPTDNEEYQTYNIKYKLTDDSLPLPKVEYRLEISHESQELSWEKIKDEPDVEVYKIKEGLYYPSDLKPTSVLDFIFPIQNSNGSELRHRIYICQSIGEK